MEKAKIQELIDIAIAQLSYSYTPYSHFKVGAALLGKNGQIYTGCNMKMQPILQQTVRKEQRFLKLSVKVRESLRPSVL